jgi:hypothetical protein
MLHWGIESFLQKKSLLGSTDAGGRVECEYDKPIWAESKLIVEINHSAGSFDTRH